MRNPALDALLKEHEVLSKWVGASYKLPCKSPDKHLWCRSRWVLEMVLYAANDTYLLARTIEDHPEWHRIPSQCGHVPAIPWVPPTPQLDREPRVVLVRLPESASRSHQGT